MFASVGSTSLFLHAHHSAQRGWKKQAHKHLKTTLLCFFIVQIWVTSVTLTWTSVVNVKCVYLCVRHTAVWCNVASLCSLSPQHIEECCGWLNQKLTDLNAEQYHIVHQHQEQVRLPLYRATPDVLARGEKHRKLLNLWINVRLSVSIGPMQPQV